MRTTIPVAMFFIKQANYLERVSFSFLYLAYAIGAMLGALISSFVLFELVGFKNTLLIAEVLNFLIVFICFVHLKNIPEHQVLSNKIENNEIKGGIQYKKLNYCFFDLSYFLLGLLPWHLKLFGQALLFQF